MRVPSPGWTLLLAVLVAGASLAVPPLPPRQPDASDAFFDAGRIPRLKLTLSPEALDKLRKDARSYVEAKMTEDGGKTYGRIAVKLKGAAGSFRGVDDRPALTIKMDRFAKGPLFHDMDKFHLNNSVQDETYLHELLCSELFQQAGVPATRVAHARVWLNDRDLGLYVLKEGFSKRFLRRWFRDPSGNLYDGGFLKDLDGDLEKDGGAGPDDRSDLKAVVAACRHPDPAQRVRLLEERVDLDRFLTFMAIERMTCHWDGYSLNANNYRVYFDPGNQGRAVFFPHGMDQMFGDVGMGLRYHPHPMLAAAVMQSNVLRQRYLERCKALLPKFFPADPLIRRAEEVRQRLAPLLRDLDPNRAKEHAQRVREFKDRLRARGIHLRDQLKQPDEQPLSLGTQGRVRLEGWYPNSENEDALVREVGFLGRRWAYGVAVGPSGRGVASWRTQRLLAAGHYRLTARAACRGVVPLDNERGGGVAIRLSQEGRRGSLSGTQPWTTLSHDFTIREDQRVVEFVLELRAKAGVAFFDPQSIELHRIDR
jgi:hypothetical protein